MYLLHAHLDLAHKQKTPTLHVDSQRCFDFLINGLAIEQPITKSVTLSHQLSTPVRNKYTSQSVIERRCYSGNIVTFIIAST